MKTFISAILILVSPLGHAGASAVVLEEQSTRQLVAMIERLVAAQPEVRGKILKRANWYMHREESTPAKFTDCAMGISPEAFEQELGSILREADEKGEDYPPRLLRHVIRFTNAGI